MSTTTDYISVMESWLPDSFVIADIQGSLQTAANNRVELDAGPIEIPTDCRYEVISKALINQQSELGFGDCFRVVVAIGGVSAWEHGIPAALFCFATVWYSLEKHVITIDYHREYR